MSTTTKPKRRTFSQLIVERVVLGPYWPVAYSPPLPVDDQFCQARGHAINCPHDTTDYDVSLDD